MRPQSLELFFDSRPAVRLARTVFAGVHPGRGTFRALAAADLARVPEGGPGTRTFQQTRGVRAFALALVRLRARRGKPDTGKTWQQPLLEGGRGSAAASLDAVLQRPDDAGWLRAMLDSRHATGGSGSLKARLDGWFLRRNSNLNDRSQPVRVFARAPGHAASLSPEEVEVSVDGVAAGAATLAAVEAALAAGFTGGGASGEVALTGTPMPPAETAAELFVGREEARAWLDAALSGSNHRLVQVVARGGMGKTGLVESWLRVAMGAGPAGGFAFQRVFRWDFRREAFAAIPAPASKTWGESLATALGVRLPAGSSPAEVVGMLAPALAGRRTLLVLDGLEVALFPPGDPRAGEFRDGALPLLLNALFHWEGEGKDAPACILTTRQAVPEVATLGLPGLADGVSRTLLRRLGVEASAEETAAAVRFAGGRPLFLRRLAGWSRDGWEVPPPSRLR